jgi:hypothetical protein
MDSSIPSSFSAPMLLSRYTRAKSCLSKAQPRPRSFYQSPRIATLSPLDGTGGDLPRSKSADSVPGEPDPIADFDCAPAGVVRRLSRPDLVLPQTPPLPPPDSPRFSAALAAKLSVCDADCFWEAAEADSAAKKIKTEALTEILELARACSDLPPPIVSQIFESIEKPLFRPFTDVSPVWLRSDDMVTYSEPAWPHYSINFQILKELIGAFPDHPRFGATAQIQSILERFVTPDSNERLALADLVVAIQRAKPAIADQVLKMALNITVSYMDGQKSPHAVAPALVVVFRTLQKNRRPLKILAICNYTSTIFCHCLVGFITCHITSKLGKSLSLLSKRYPCNQRRRP